MKKRNADKSQFGSFYKHFEELDLDQKLFASIDAFRCKLSSELCLSQNSILSYLSDLLQFMRWNKSNTEEDSQSIVFEKSCLQKYLSENNFSNASMRRKISSISSWKKFCEEEFEIELDFELPNIKTKKTVPKIISNEDVGKLLQHEDLDERLRTIILLLNATGMRISELLSMEYNNLRHVLEKGHDTFRIIGKGNKERTIFLDEISLEALQKYCFNNNITKGNIWKGITRQCIYIALKKLSQKAGIQPSKVYPHSFRHRIGSNLSQAGMTLVELQQFLGHASINTTSIYTHLEDELTYRMVLEHHPLGEGKKKLGNT